MHITEMGLRRLTLFVPTILAALLIALVCAPPSRGVTHKPTHTQVWCAAAAAYFHATHRATMAKLNAMMTASEAMPWRTASKNAYPGEDTYSVYGDTRSETLGKYGPGDLHDLHTDFTVLCQVQVG